MCSAARNPSSLWVGGSRMSTMTTSGGSERTLASRSSALPNRPTTSKPGVPEQPGQALAQQDAVLGDGYPHGISALTRVPPPTGLQTRSRPSSASTRSASPRRPEPASVSAPPPPSSVISTTSRPSTLRDVDRGRCRAGVLAHVGDALRDDVVRRHLHGVRQPSRQVHREPDRHRRPRGEGLQGDGQTVPAEHGRVEPAGQIPQLVERQRRPRRFISSTLPLASASSLRRSRSTASSRLTATSRCWAPSCRLRSSRWRSR